MDSKNRVPMFEILLSMVLTFNYFGCGGGSSTTASTPPAGSVSVTVSPPSATVPAGGTQTFTATVANDSAGRGVTWTVSCSAAPCGTVSPSSTLSGIATTYTAPSTAPASNLTVILTATSQADPTKSMSATITVPATSGQQTITYTVQATASGTLGSASFTDATVTIVFVSLTSTAHLHSGTVDLWQNSGTGTVTVSDPMTGMSSTATLSAGPVAFDEQGGPTHSCAAIPCVAGIGAGMPVGPTLLGISNDAFLTYGLTSPIAPVQGTPVISTSLTVGTTLGGLSFSSVGATGTFTATTP